MTREARASKRRSATGGAWHRAREDGVVRVCLRFCSKGVLLQALAHDDGHRSLARGFAANEERNVVLAEIYDRALEHERARGKIEGFLTSNLERDEGAAVSRSEGRNQTNAGWRRCATGVVVGVGVASE